MIGRVLISIIAFVSFFGATFAKNNVVQGPFHLKDTVGISIEFIKKSDESISFQEINKGGSKELDNYEVGDGVPTIETVFFDSVRNQKVVVVLVSWDEENIKAVHYKIYGYNYNGTGVSGENDCLSKDKKLEGYDGYSGNGMTYNFKNAVEIKRYIHVDLPRLNEKCR